MPRVKCLIIDDEPLARKLIAGYIDQLQNWEIIGSCKNAVEAYEKLMQEEITVIFLDINMPAVNGIDFYKSLKNPPFLIFTTAYPEYAVEGFELDALDYLVKPITFERFLKAVARLNEKLSLAQGRNGNNHQIETHDYLFIKHLYKMVKVNFPDILYLEARKDYVKFVINKEELMANMTMKQAEELLPDTHFLRVHRSFIISLNAVTSFYGNTIEIGLHQIPIGTNYKDKAMQVLGK